MGGSASTTYLPMGVLGGLGVDQGLTFVLERPRVVVVQGS